MNWKALVARRRIAAPWIIVLLGALWIVFIAFLIATGPAPGPGPPAP